MYAPPPEANCIKIYSYHCKNQIDFYDKLGMLFTKTTTEDGRMCHTYIYDDFHFVIQEVSSELEASRNLELRFFIDEIEGYLPGLREMGIEIIKPLWATETHQHIILKDPNGHLVELMTQK